MISPMNTTPSCAVGDSACPATRKALPDATQNACKLCTPLGACLAFAGVRGCLTILHGSQGCATYIRRYLISHFREPMDIASSSFSEEDAVFGGGRNLKLGIYNVAEAYSPEVIGVATTCLAETIGEDVPAILREYKIELPEGAPNPLLVNVSTPSYSGDHSEGFHAAVKALVEQLGRCEEMGVHINVMPGMISCEDIRYLKDVFKSFHLDNIMLPDYSDTLDGGSWDEYQRIPQGGTSLQEIERTGSAKASIEFGSNFNKNGSAAKSLESKFGVKRYGLTMPIGVRSTDAFFDVLEELSGLKTHDAFLGERSRLVDSYVDGHKYLFGKTAAVFGDPDMVVSIAGFLSEIGVKPIICATGSKCDDFTGAVQSNLVKEQSDIFCLSGADHAAIAETCRKAQPDLLIGNSKGYPIARELGVPLIRCGLPVHDRVGSQRILHLGYKGAQRLFDQIVNTLLDVRQDSSEIGFSYL